MYARKSTSKTDDSTGKSSGGYAGSELPQTIAKYRPIHTCKCGAQSSAGSCPRGH